MRRILDDAEDLTLTMAHRSDVGRGAISILRRVLPYTIDETINDRGLMLARRAVFAAYVDARDAGVGDLALALVNTVKPSRVARGGVVIKRARRKQ